MKTRVPLSNLRLKQQEKVKITSAYFQKRCEDGQSSCQGSRELDIRGQTAMEALLDVDNFMVPL